MRAWCPILLFGFYTTNSPTERPKLLNGVRHLRGNGLFRRHLTLRSIEPRSTICKIQGVAAPKAQTGWSISAKATTPSAPLKEASRHLLKEASRHLLDVAPL